MNNNKSIDRLSFLAEKYNIFDDTDEGMSEVIDYLTLNRRVFTNLASNDDVIFAIVSNEAFDLDGNQLNPNVSKITEEGYGVTNIQCGNQKPRVDIPFNVFNKMVNSDPSKNKMYTQWMLNVFTRYIKNGEYNEAEMFFSEDLPLAKDYLKIFEKNKRKKKFKELSSNSFVLKGVKDPTDINQYKSLSQLYDAVDPFIEKDPSNIEKLINSFVECGKAEIPVRDRRFTLYIPKCEEASLIFDEFVGWCTAKSKGDMFEFYRGNSKYRRPNGDKSDIYIVIDNKFFTGTLKSDSLYQLHFESRQVRDRIQSKSNNFFDKVILNSEGISNFIYEELTTMAKMKKNKNTNDNVYIDYLVKFGWTEALFDIIEEYSPIIRFTNRDVPRLPDVSRFKNLTTLIIKKANLIELHPSIGNLQSLQELLIPDNNLTVIPKEIGKLKKLIFINIIGNKIKSIPDDIKYLDKSNGGNLHRIAFRREDIGESNYKKLKKLLPSTMM
tara:strand:+ start:2638 stop:4122 length:1485 start_codon:yes stop_codon:yes gene_type:complete